jgi:hypothetical protein
MKIIDEPPVIARSEATKQSSQRLLSGLLRYARNDEFKRGISAAFDLSE